MRTVELRLPEAVLAGLDPGPDGVRGADDIVVAMDVISTVSGLITIASLREQLPALARRVRSWRGAHPEEEPTLSIKAPGIDVELPLPPNVGVQTIVDALTRALDGAENGEDGAAR